jgi:hypothetical protein
MSIFRFFHLLLLSLVFAAFSCTSFAANPEPLSTSFYAPLIKVNVTEPLAEGDVTGSGDEGDAGSSDSPDGGDGGGIFAQWVSRFEFWLVILVMVFGITIAALQYALIRKRNFSANDIMKIFAVTLIITGTLFLISAGFGDTQIAPAMGLFGTVAGYILGRSTADKESSTTDRSDQNEIKK